MCLKTQVVGYSEQARRGTHPRTWLIASASILAAREECTRFKTLGTVELRLVFVKMCCNNNGLHEHVPLPYTALNFVLLPHTPLPAFLLPGVRAQPPAVER